MRTLDGGSSLYGPITDWFELDLRGHDCVGREVTWVPRRLRRDGAVRPRRPYLEGALFAPVSAVRGAITPSRTGGCGARGGRQGASVSPGRSRSVRVPSLQPHGVRTTDGLS
ncbi:hypothetical protein NN561_018039 [Cricetulus griseus]